MKYLRLIWLILILFKSSEEVKRLLHVTAVMRSICFEGGGGGVWSGNVIRKNRSLLLVLLEKGMWFFLIRIDVFLSKV